MIRGDAIATGTGDCILCLYLFLNPLKYNPAGPLTGATWVNSSTDPSLLYSTAEYDVSSTALDISGVTYPFKRISVNYLSKSTEIISSGILQNVLRIASDIAGNSDWVVIGARTISGGQTVAASLQWQEFY